VNRIAVTQPFDRLSHRTANILLALEQGSDVRVEWMIERLGLTRPAQSRNYERRAESLTQGPQPTSATEIPATEATGESKTVSLGKFGYVKRAFDILAAICLILLFAPVILLVGLLVSCDVGFPLVFWQQRPGRYGRPFKLYKFCTMGPAHDAQGGRVPDNQRSSRVGALIRRTKLDELPQLYNILIGDMSFVGPRPLLPADQPLDATCRLSVRPGLTGYAQVCGGRHISAEDKNALDSWYVRNASLWLDIRILLRTLMVVTRGERVNHMALRAARDGLGYPTTATVDPSSLASKRSFVGDGQVQVAAPLN
jgi:lipopolysaccharide/colanic/teichoic acid biosynthesis glycosyltransferase